MRQDAAGTGRLTPYRELDDVLSGFATTLLHLLGEKFVGLYLLGSLAIGDFDRTSDVDFMIVTHDELSAGDVQRVQSAHGVLLSQDNRWVRRVEYSIFSRAQLSQRARPAGRDSSSAQQPWYVINGGTTLEKSGHDDTLVTRWTLRYKSTTVLGPDPKTFAPQVTANELRGEIKASLIRWETVFTVDSPFNNRFHQVFFVLNSCRALQDLHEGKITSKREGVVWAKQHLDPRWHCLIDVSWQERQDTEISVSQPADTLLFEQTLAFVAYTARLAEAYPIPHS